VGEWQKLCGPAEGDKNAEGESGIKVKFLTLGVS